MSESMRFTLSLEHLEDYEFKVRFDQEALDDMLVDEPPPLGSLSGPNPSRLLAVAAANCLSASLLYCVSRDQVESNSLHTRVTVVIDRNEKKRLRLTSLSVSLQMSQNLSQATKSRRCLELFEDFCVVTDSIRKGIPVEVEVRDHDGQLVHSSK